MTYVDGFVLPVKKKNLSAYRKAALAMAKITKKHGALRYVKAVGEDLFPKDCGFPFPKMAKAKSDETVVFAFITYKSKAHRNQIMKKIVADPSMAPEKWKNKPMPFDMKRMAYGGFETIVER